jgi:hypothetical protein
MDCSHPLMVANMHDATRAVLMAPINRAAERIAQRAADLEARSPEPALGDLQDQRTEALAELLDALDALEPGLGQRLHLVLYPGADALRSGGELGRRPGLSQAYIQGWRECNGLDPATGRRL